MNKCQLCGDQLEHDESPTEMSCCKAKVHERCLKICDDYLFKCPICRGGTSQIKIRFEYLPSQVGGIVGLSYTWNLNLRRLQAIRNQHYPSLNRPDFGRTIHFYIPSSGDFTSCAEADRLRFLDLVELINQVPDEEILHHIDFIEGPLEKIIEVLLPKNQVVPHQSKKHKDHGSSPKHVGSKERKPKH